MRISSAEANVIREEVRRLDPAAEIYLFGSRTDDAARGGDIDLLVVSANIGKKNLLRLRRTILDQIGWQQLDLVVRRNEEVDEPLAVHAMKSGIKL